MLHAYKNTVLPIIYYGTIKRKTVSVATLDAFFFSKQTKSYTETDAGEQDNH